MQFFTLRDSRGDRNSSRIRCTVISAAFHARLESEMKRAQATKNNQLIGRCLIRELQRSTLRGDMEDITKQRNVDWMRAQLESERLEMAELLNEIIAAPKKNNRKRAAIFGYSIVVSDLRKIARNLSMLESGRKPNHAAS